MKITVYRDKKKEWRWRWVAANGRIIGDSGEGYKRRKGCFEFVTKLRFALESTYAETIDMEIIK